MHRFTRDERADLRENARLAMHQMKLFALATSSRNRNLYAEEAVRIQEAIEALIEGVNAE